MRALDQSIRLIKWSHCIHGGPSHPTVPKVGDTVQYCNKVQKVFRALSNSSVISKDIIWNFDYIVGDLILQLDAIYQSSVSMLATVASHLTLKPDTTCAEHKYWSLLSCLFFFFFFKGARKRGKKSFESPISEKKKSLIFGPCLTLKSKEAKSLWIFRH